MTDGATTGPGATGADDTIVRPREPVDRAAALAAGAPGIPRRVIVFGLVAAAVLALGGTAVERLFSSAGLNPQPAVHLTPNRPVPTSAPAPPVLGAPLAAFLGLKRLPPEPAPDITLVDQTGRALSLGQYRGTPVVISFFDAGCDDICPVLATELREADTDLGAARNKVVFLTVNTDPLDTAISTGSPAVSETGLGSLGNWRFLSGTLAELDTVWRQYGLSIEVSNSTGTVAHNNVIYFVDRHGQLHFRATPVADESTTGSYTLPASAMARSARGIATYSLQLLHA